MAQWILIQVVTHAEAVEALTYHLDRMGSTGVAAIQDAGQLNTSRHTVKAYFPPDERVGDHALLVRRILDEIAELGIETSPGRVAIKTVEFDDWDSTWKAFFKPKRYGRIMITPSWEPIPDDAPDAVVVLDPGLAFGTGAHASTQLCLDALNHVHLDDARVADVGTGSGILAIAALKLGARSVDAVDVDARALTVAAENVRNNGLEEHVQLHEGTIDLLTGPYDLVMMNILAEIIVPALPMVRDRLAPQGTAIFSGITDDQADRVASELDAAAFIVRARPSLDGWTAFVAQPPSPTKDTRPSAGEGNAA